MNAVHADLWDQVYTAILESRDEREASDAIVAAVRAHLTAPETVERVARVWAAEVPPIQHGQLCPCWTKKAAAEACDCFVIFNRRSLAGTALAALAAALAPEEGGSDG